MRKLILLFLMLIGFTAFGQVVNSSILNNSQYISGKKQTVAPTAPPVGFIRVYNFNDSLHFKNSVRDWNLGKIIYQDSLDYYYTKTQTDSIGNKIMDTVYLYADSLGYLRDTVYLYIDSIDQLQNDSIKYVLRDGTRQLTGDWDAGAFKISNTDIIQGNVLISNNGINGYLTEFNSSKAIDTAFIYHSGNEYRINTTTDNGAFQLQVAGGGYFGGTTRISSATSPRLDFLRAATKQWQIGIPASVNRFSILEDGTDERFVIKAGGNVGIKVTDPVATLDVNGSIRSRTGIFQLNDGTTTGGGLYFYKAITGSGSSLAPTLFAETGNALYFMVNGSSATPKAMLTSGGKFNINDVSNTTYDLYVNGTAKVVTSVTTPTIKLTTGASVNYIWKCSNADGSGAWVALAASETYKGVVDGDDGKINHGATALIDGTGTSGDYYRCYDAGTYDYGNPSGNSITLEIGDEVHYDGAKWQYQEGVGYTLQAMDATTLGGAKLGGSLQINSEVLNIANADMSDITVLGTGTDVGKIWTIDNDVVTYAKMQNISAQWKILGRSSSGAGDTEELSMSGTGNVVGDISPVITDSIRVPAVAFGSAWVNSTGALDRGSAYPKFVAASDSITKHKGWYYSLRDSVITSMGDIINIGDSITKHTGWHYSLRDSVSNSMDSITMHTTNYYSLRDSVRSILDIRLPAIENDTTNWNIAWDSVAVFDTRLDALELTNTGTNTGDVTLFGNSGLAFHSGQTGLHMGTPSSITASSTNSVTDTTHTHAITGVPSPFYVGATSMTSTGVQLNYLKDATGTTGTTSTNLVFSTSPTLVTPTLGVATATSINKVAITAPATSATLTIANGKTLTASNTLTLAGTDATVMTFPTTSATIARTDAGQTFTGVNTMSDSLLVPIRAYNSTTFNNSKRTVSEDSFRDKIETITAGGLLPAGTEGQTLYNNAGTWTASSSRFWDDVNGYYGINTATPERTLAIHGVGSGDSKIGLYVNKTGTDQLIFSLGNTGSGQNDGLLSIWDNGTKKVNIAANNSRGGDSYFNGGGNLANGTNDDLGYKFYNNGTLYNNGAVTIAGTLALGANNLTMTGSLAATGARVTKGWFADLEVTNTPTINGTAMSSIYAGIAQTFYLGTTSIAINRASAAQSLTGITSIDGSAAKLTTARTIGGTSFDGTTNIKIGALSSTNIDATTSAQFAGVVSDETGTDKLVFNTSPILVTPNIGTATATSVNGLTLTTQAIGFTIAGGTTLKTLTVGNTITLSGTDGSTLAIGTGGTLGTAAYTPTTNYTPVAHKTTEDALNGLVKVDGAGNYSAITDYSGLWTTAYSWGNHAAMGYLTSANNVPLHQNIVNDLTLAGQYSQTYRQPVNQYQAMAAGEYNPHASLVIGNYYYVLTRSTPAKLFQYSCEDVSSSTSLTFPNDGLNKSPDQMLYINGKIYVAMSNSGKLRVKQVNPTVLNDTTTVISYNSPSFISGVPMLCDGTYLYIASNSAAGMSYADSLYKYQISDWSQVAKIKITGSSTDYPHALATDGEKIFITTTAATASLNRVYVVDVATFSLDASSIITYSPMSDEMVVTGDKLYIGKEDATGYILVIDKSVSPMTKDSINTGIAAACYGVFFDGKDIWATMAGTPGGLAKIDPYTGWVSYMTFPSGYNNTNEVSFEGGRMFVTFYANPFSVARITLPKMTPTAVGGGVSAVTASAPLTSSGGSTPNLTISQSTTATNGYLSSTDWNTFNGKAAANQTMYIGTTGVAINRGTGALTLAGITLTDPIFNTSMGFNGTASANSNFTIKKSGSISASNVGYYLSHRDNNTDFQIFGYDGTTYKTHLAIDWDGLNTYSAGTYHKFQKYDNTLQFESDADGFNIPSGKVYQVNGANGVTNTYASPSSITVTGGIVTAVTAGTAIDIMQAKVTLTKANIEGMYTGGTAIQILAGESGYIYDIISVLAVNNLSAQSFGTQSIWILNSNTTSASSTTAILGGSGFFSTGYYSGVLQSPWGGGTSDYGARIYKDGGVYVCRGADAGTVTGSVDLYITYRKIQY